MSKLRSRRIQAKLSSSPGFEVVTMTGDKVVSRGRLQVRGWMQGRETYLWFGVGAAAPGHAICVGILGKAKLYRLAKAIVRHYESDKAPFGQER